MRILSIETSTEYCSVALWQDGTVSERCELVDLGTSHQVLGHLDGWGRGLHSGQNLPAYPGTRGNTHAAFATYFVRGTGTLDLEIGSCRAGFLRVRLTI